ncbi:MAG: CBS domain-containing protein [Sphingomonadales bacterium]|nr:CBS domain-containing protein [Sphingomonadales bacterium]
MTSPVTSIDCGATLRDAATAMRDDDVGSLPITRDGKLCGVVTDRDIVLRAIAEGIDASSCVADVMTSKVTTVASDCDVEKAAKLMSDQQIRRLYVVDDDMICGVVALGDLAVDPQGEDAGEALRAISKSEATSR